MSDLSVHLYGSPVASDLDNAGAAIVGLLDVVAHEMGAGIKWKIGGWNRECDRCGFTVPFGDGPPAGWVNDGTYDICDHCRLEMTS